MCLISNRIEIDENTNLQQSLEHSYDDNARIKRDLDQSKRDAQKLASELESVKVFVILLYYINLDHGELIHVNHRNLVKREMVILEILIGIRKPK